MDKNLMRSYAAELIGTFALVFVGAGVVCINAMTERLPDMHPGLVGIALANGLILAVGLSVTLHVSGGYLNPAITLMLWSFNRLDTVKMAWYIGAQLLGAALAGLCLYNLFTLEVLRASSLGTPHINLKAFGMETATWRVILTGTGIEIALTFVVVLAIFGTILDPRGQRTAGLTVGLALAAVTFLGFPLTGAATNPARWFGTVIWERSIQESTLKAMNPFGDMFVYVAGPILGALLAGVVYYKLILPADRHEGVFGPLETTPASNHPPFPTPTTQVKVKK